MDITITHYHQEAGRINQRGERVDFSRSGSLKHQLVSGGQTTRQDGDGEKVVIPWFVEKPCGKLT